MFLRMVYDEKLAQAAYLIGCQRTGEAIVIAQDVDRYIDLATACGSSRWPIHTFMPTICPGRASWPK